MAAVVLGLAPILALGIPELLFLVAVLVEGITQVVLPEAPVS
jgi:hypothetical protein